MDHYVKALEEARQREMAMLASMVPVFDPDTAIPPQGETQMTTDQPADGLGADRG